MDLGEYLFPLPSVRAFISDKLNIYKMNERELPDMEWYSDLGAKSAEWVNTISDEDDTMVSELIYWWRREQL